MRRFLFQFSLNKPYLYFIAKIEVYQQRVLCLLWYNAMTTFDYVFDLTLAMLSELQILMY